MRAVAIAAALTSLAGSPTCGARSNSKTASDNPAGPCTTKLEPPYVGKFNGAKAVIVKSTSSCLEAQVTHVVNLSIEHFVDHGGWQPIPGFDGAPWHICNELPVPGHDTACTQAVPCVLPGKYRGRALITGTSAANRPLRVPVDQQPEATITCQ